MLRRLAILLGLGVFGLALAGCGGGTSSSHWADLQRVTVSLSRPLAPPLGGPFTKVYADAPDLTRVTVLLNRHHIVQLASPTSNAGCTGGYIVAMKITRKGSPPATLNAYRCANHTTGDVGGDLVGFLTALGFQIA